MRKLVALTLILSVASFASAEVILDQIEFGGNTSAAQDFEAAYDVYDCAVVDDFTMTMDGTLTSIESVHGFWNGAGTENISWCTGFNIGIFSDSGLIATTLVGDVANLTNVPYTTGDTATNLAQFDVSIPLTAGTYWISVQAIQDYAVAGQVGIIQSTIGDLSAVQGNPGGGFSIPGNMQAIGASGAYRIEGTYVPEPASLLLFGLAGLLIRRR